MCKINSCATAVLCLTVVLGLFVSTAAAENIYVYDFDRCTVDAALKTSDNWSSNNYNTTMVLDDASASGWSGNYAEITSTSGNAEVLYRANDTGPTGWGYTLVDGVDFDYSCVVRCDGDKYHAMAGLSNTEGPTVAANLLCGVYSGGDLVWYVNGYYKDIAAPTGDKRVEVGVTFEFVSEGNYKVQRWYENLTDGGGRQNVGTKIDYAIDDLSTEWNRLMIHMWAKSADSTKPLSGGRLDNMTVSQVPEPSTLALLTAGLIGLLAYAWRKRK